MNSNDVEQYVLLASDASNPQLQQQANALLNQWVSTTDEMVLADALLQVLRSTRRDVVLFYVLTTYLRLRNTQPQQRATVRQEVFTQILASSSNNNGSTSSSINQSTNSTNNINDPSINSLSDIPSAWSPSFLRTKVGVLLARFIQLDFPTSWPNAFADLQNQQLLQWAPDIFLRTMVALTEDFGKDETQVNTRIKDLVRGYNAGTQLGKTDVPNAPQQPTVNPKQTISAEILASVTSLLSQSLGNTTNGQHHQYDANSDVQLQICLLSLTVIKGLMPWLDLSLLLEDHVMNLIFAALARASTTDSPSADSGVVAIECLVELVARGMEDDKKVAMLVHTNALAKIHSCIDLETVDVSPIDVVLEVAKFINRTGLEIIHEFAEPQQEHINHNGHNNNNHNSSSSTVITSQILDIFFRCFAYDDIDVSGAVIPLAGSLVQGIKYQREAFLSQLLTVTFRQMRYPIDFEFDYEDEDEAEEEMYRTELRKLNQKLIRVAPEPCLQFTVQTLSQLSIPLSTSPTPDIEAALRLVYHYCEGIRPPPGMKVVMKNETFRNLLTALHTSDIIFHPHREVLTLYYETSVRYYPLLKDRVDLLQKLLEALTGPRGLQHEHPRVRSRCCYMLLRLVKSVGSSNNTKANVLRPYVETAVHGIQSLLGQESVNLRVDDTLNLFEVIGLLLGKTGLEPSEQQKYLTNVMTPHVLSIERMLEQKETLLKQDPDMYGEILSGSIAAIAFLTKGFKSPPKEVQVVLLETLKIALVVLETLPTSELIRNKEFILIQRLIQCLGEQVLSYVPQFLHLFISHCTTVDVLDVAQLMNQLCIKFKSTIIPILDISLLPFLRKCHILIHSLGITTTTSETDNNTNTNNTTLTGIGFGSLSTSSTVPTGAIATTTTTIFHNNNNKNNNNAKDTSSLSAPHHITEQLSIQKLTYIVLQHIVIHDVTPILYSTTNISSLESILQLVADGAMNVSISDPIIKKTCIGFFRELLDSFISLSTGSSLNNNNNNNDDGIITSIKKENGSTSTTPTAALTSSVPVSGVTTTATATTAAITTDVSSTLTNKVPTGTSSTSSSSSSTSRMASSSTPPPPAIVVEGYIKFLIDILVPGVVLSFCNKSIPFNINDANQWRCVVECASLLDLLQERLVPELYYQQIIIGIFVTRLGCPEHYINGLQFSTTTVTNTNTNTNGTTNATTTNNNNSNNSNANTRRKAIEIALKQIIIESRKS